MSLLKTASLFGAHQCPIKNFEKKVCREAVLSRLVLFILRARSLLKYFQKLLRSVTCVFLGINFLADNFLRVGLFQNTKPGVPVHTTNTPSVHCLAISVLNFESIQLLLSFSSRYFADSKTRRMEIYGNTRDIPFLGRSAASCLEFSKSIRNCFRLFETRVFGRELSWTAAIQCAIKTSSWCESKKKQAYHVSYVSDSGQ